MANTDMTVEGLLGYLKYRHPAKYAQFREQMQLIDGNRTSGTRFPDSLKCMQKWAEHAKYLMTLAAAGKTVGCETA